MALAELGSDTGIIITKPNADTGGKLLIGMIDKFVASHDNAHAYTSLGQLRYLSTLAQVDAVVGNSSSGLYEAPSFKIPTINIGDRQKGRLQAASVINCEPVAKQIMAAINRAFRQDCSGVTNPYGDGNSSLRILQSIKAISDPRRLLMKHFHEVR